MPFGTTGISVVSPTDAVPPGPATARTAGSTSQQDVRIAQGMHACIFRLWCMIALRVDPTQWRQFAFRSSLCKHGHMPH